ncbi:helix-turn-helix domain-containing protein [Methylobacterium aquaticum]|uniref:Putative two component transcriptionalregulator, winged helix family n=1 Tax=Methylobacterium aquaticum TaxID=270351 RepID=A0A0C6FBZ5_9HYPH|nr:winged helix-turn-helix domain-containing protein [Methylobacterium aquaticum]BAQ44357.1 putative two component transcriptionalregulator, winged helix family [Methylobacterium aquaticum]
MTPDAHADPRPNAGLRHRSVAAFDHIVRRVDRLEGRIRAPKEVKLAGVDRRLRRLEDADLVARLDDMARRLDRIEKVLDEGGLALANELLPSEWGLTTQEAAMLKALADQPQGFLHKEGIYIALYGEISASTPHPKIIDVVVCKTRKKIAPFGIVIETVWGRGYQIAPAGRDIIRAAIARDTRKAA